MLRPVSGLLAVVLHRADAFLLRQTNGRHSITAIAGLPIIRLSTLGARSGLPRTLPLVGLIDGERIALIASNFGRAHHPGWYYNLKANPICTVHFGGRKGEYSARQAEGAEREKYWKRAVSHYQGYELYRTRAARRVIPVMVLEPLTPLPG
jgi:deazaflavin-dependent oxidoreductase (nitroreductase family)